MKKRIIATLSVFLMIGMVGCTSNKAYYELEYKSEYQPEKLFDLKENKDRNYSVDVDTSIVGIYQVELRENQEIQKYQVVVKDSHAPEISLLQNKTKKVALNTTYNPIGNIDMIKDNADGEMKNIEIVTMEQFEIIEKDIEQQKKKTEKNVFKSNEEVEEYKKERIKGGYTVLSSNVDTSQVGTYQVIVMSIDQSYNTTKKEYKIEVVDGTIKENELAAGSEGGKQGNAIAYDIVDTTVIKNEEAKEEVNANQNQSNTTMGKVISNSSNKIPSITNAIAVAAKNRVGQGLHCDELVNAALKDAGKLEASAWVDPNVLFKFATKINTSQAKQGDIIYYSNGGLGYWHMAVYLGNGIAVHGGWNGQANVQIASSNIGGGPTFYRFPNYLSKAEIAKFYFGNSGGSGNNESIVETPDSGDLGNWKPNDKNDSWETTTYKRTISLNDDTIQLVSNKPFDYAAIETIEDRWFNGEITKEQAVTEFQALGYTVTY